MEKPSNKIWEKRLSQKTNQHTKGKEKNGCETLAEH